MAWGAGTPYWDNVRHVAITLVGVCRSIERLDSSDLTASLYFVIHLLHVPLFAFVSGRSSSADPGRSSAVTRLRPLIEPRCSSHRPRWRPHHAQMRTRGAGAPRVLVAAASPALLLSSAGGPGGAR